MKKGSLYIFPLLYVLLGTFIFMSPSSMLFAQDDAVEEIFWGDDDEGDLDEEFDFSEDDEEFSDDEESLEGFDFDDEFGDDDFGDDDFDDEGSDDFAEDFAEPEEDMAEAADRLGYTLNLSGSSPGFVNHQLQSYNSSVDARVSFEMPILLQIAGIRFRLGAEVGTFNFKNYLPRGGEYKGIHATGILSFPAGPGQVKFGAGLVGGGMGIVAENTYGMSIGSALDLRFGLRSTTSFGAKDSKKYDLGTVSWMDGIIALGFSL
tara:strand:- start:316 stop:1101 length:786 start_codon:yes stop_codon:yes gene_type:complete